MCPDSVDVGAQIFLRVSWNTAFFVPPECWDYSKYGIYGAEFCDALCASSMLVFTQVAEKAAFYWLGPSALMIVNAFLVQPLQAAGWNLFPNVTLLEEKWSMFDTGLYLLTCTSLCQLVVIPHLKIVNDTGKEVMLFCLGYWEIVDFWEFLFHILRNASALLCCVCNTVAPCVLTCVL